MEGINGHIWLLVLLDPGRLGEQITCWILPPLLLHRMEVTHPGKGEL